MDFSKIASLVRRYLWLLALAALIASFTTYFVLSRQPANYTVTTDLLVGPGLDTPSPDLNSLKIGGQLGQTYAELLSTDSFLESVNNKLPQKMHLIDLQGAISNRQSADTRVLTITVNYANPDQAIAIANAAAQTLLEISPSKNNVTASLRARMSDQSHQLEQVVNDSQSSIQQLEQQLAALKAAQPSYPDPAQSSQAQQNPSGTESRIQQLEQQLANLQAALPPPADVEAARLNLQEQGVLLTELSDERSLLPEAARFNLDQQNLVFTELADERNRLSNALQTLANVYQILLGPDTNQIEIIQPATAAIPIDQRIWLKVLASGIGGLVFALIIIFAADYFDDRLRFPGELSRAAGVPLLSTIERYTLQKDSGLERLITFAQPESDAANRYREAVAKLLYLIGDSKAYSFMVGSLGSNFGTDAAVTAGNLAIAFAQAGYQVTLVDAQVDNPTLTPVFKANKQEGLTDLLITNSTELQLLPVEQVPNLQFLPTGLSPERSSHAMLNSPRAAALFDRLQKGTEIVLVAGSAMSQAAENLTLASHVNSVILVTGYAEERRKVVNQVVENFRLMKIKLAGVIFDYNASPLIPKQIRKLSFAFGRGTSREVSLKDNLAEQTTES